VALPIYFAAQRPAEAIDEAVRPFAFGGRGWAAFALVIVLDIDAELGLGTARIWSEDIGRARAGETVAGARPAPSIGRALGVRPGRGRRGPIRHGGGRPLAVRCHRLRYGIEGRLEPVGDVIATRWRVRAALEGARKQTAQTLRIRCVYHGADLVLRPAGASYECALRPCLTRNCRSAPGIS